LDGTCTRPHVGIIKGIAAQHTSTGCASVAADHDAHGRFANSFKLEVEQMTGGLRFEFRRLRQAFLIGQQGSSVAGLGFGDDHETPWLGLPNGWRVVAGCKHALKQPWVERIGSVATDITPSPGDVVERLAILGRERPAVGRSGAIGRGRGVTDKRYRAWPRGQWLCSCECE
jgi:hypothetical protein